MDSRNLTTAHPLPARNWRSCRAGDAVLVVRLTFTGRGTPPPLDVRSPLGYVPRRGRIRLRRPDIGRVKVRQASLSDGVHGKGDPPRVGTFTGGPPRRRGATRTSARGSRSRKRKRAAEALIGTRKYRFSFVALSDGARGPPGVRPGNGVPALSEPPGAFPDVCSSPWFGRRVARKRTGNYRRICPYRRETAGESNAAIFGTASPN